MLIFFLGVFLVACRSELPILTLKQGETLVNFLLAAGRPQFSDFKTLKQGETLVNFIFGVFLVACRSELAHFKTPEGGKRLPIFCWLLAGPSSTAFAQF